jgi:hypothetical protein
MTQIEFNDGLDGGECISIAWELIKKRYGLYLGVTLLTVIIGTWLSCVSWFLLGPISAGLYYIVTRDLNDEPIEFGMMFKGFEKFVPLMVIGLIQSIPQMINGILSLFVNFASIFIPQNGSSGDIDFFQSTSSPELSGISPELPGVLAGSIIIVMLAFFVLYIVWAIVFYFAIPLTYEYDLGTIDSIKLSARAAWANLGAIIVMAVMLMLVGLLGFLLLCVGIFLISIPVSMVAYAVAYRQVFPYIRRDFNFNPPPPAEYGFPTVRLG